MQTDDSDAEAFRALGDPVRLAILRFLIGAGGQCCTVPGRVCACDIVAHLNLAQPTVSHHMAVLVRAGLVTGRKQGRWTHYTVQSSRFAALSGLLAAIGGASLAEAA